MRTFQAYPRFGGDWDRSSGPGPQSLFGILKAYDIKDQRKAHPGEDMATIALLADVALPNGAVLKAEMSAEGVPSTPLKVTSVPMQNEPEVQPGPRSRILAPLGPNTIFDLFRGRGQSLRAVPGDLVFFENVRIGRDGIARAERCYNAASREDLEQRRAWPMAGVLASVLPEERRRSAGGAGFEPTGRQFVLFPEVAGARLVRDRDELIQAISEAVSVEGVPGRPAFIVRAAILPDGPEDEAAIAAGAGGVRLAEHVLVRAVRDGEDWRAPTTDEIVAQYLAGTETSRRREEILEGLEREGTMLEVIPAFALQRSQFDVPSANPSGYDVAARHYSILAKVPEGARVFGEIHKTEEGDLAKLPGTPGVLASNVLVKVSESGNPYVRVVSPCDRFATPRPLADLPTPNLPDCHLRGIQRALAEQNRMRIAVARANRAARTAEGPEPIPDEREPAGPAPR